jgi:hypothetical protein
MVTTVLGASNDSPHSCTYNLKFVCDNPRDKNHINGPTLNKSKVGRARKKGFSKSFTLVMGNFSNILPVPCVADSLKFSALIYRPFHYF